MQEKIKWYQEVLELEPASKVFFPLARLLAESDQIDAALTTLQHGIVRHPEFIEARLYLIDLLYKYNRTAQCDEQVSQLTDLFSHYAGFWQAWGSYIAHTNKGKELSLALSFLAASFQNADLRLADIFTQGLQAMQGIAPACRANHPLPDAQKNSEGTNTTVIADVNASAAESCASVGTENSGSSPFTEAVLPTPTAPSMCEASASIEAANNTSSFSVVKQDLALTVPPLAELVQSLPATPDFTAKDDTASADADVSDDSDDNEERFSLRTRSMAEVLAEQGDFKNALDIYEELVTQAVLPEEQLDLQHRISTLTARMGTVQAQVAENPTLSNAAPGKHRLLSLLETLAVRFEAHAQG